MASSGIIVNYTIDPPSSVPAETYTSLQTQSTHTIPLELNQSSTSHPPHHLTNPPLNPSSTHDQHYTSLLHALTSTQAYTNTTLTAWKDVIGDKEKSKENVQLDEKGHKKKGMGKAAMMVRAAREDGEEKKGDSNAVVVEDEASESEDEDEIEGLEEA